MLKTLAKNENKINYKNSSYKISLLDGTFHEISFLKKYGTLYSLLEDLVTRKTTVNIAKINQTSFIINLMHGYNERDFDNKTQMGLEKGGCFYNTVLVNANSVFLDTKKISKKRNKRLLSNQI